MVIFRCSDVLSCFIPASHTIIYVFYLPTNASFLCDRTHLLKKWFISHPYLWSAIDNKPLKFLCQMLCHGNSFNWNQHPVSYDLFQRFRIASFACFPCQLLHGGVGPCLGYSLTDVKYYGIGSIKIYRQTNYKGECY